MFKKLQSKWKVSGSRLFLILCTFALGGSLCGYLARRFLTLLDLDRGVIWILLYIVSITLLWPLCVLLISIPTGQFNFFKNYLKRIFGKIAGKNKIRQVRMAILASGSGSNADKILDYFSGHPAIQPVVIITNNPKAGVLSVAQRHLMPAVVLGGVSADDYLSLFKEHAVDFIVLAGYLKKIPAEVTALYAGRIINIHPALLPRHGGRGMYGINVHRAVIAAGDAESGITIHYVDELYDHGQSIFQTAIPVNQNDTPEKLAARVLALEHEHYPQQIEKVLMQNTALSKFPVK